MSINTELVKKNLEREAQRKIKKGEILSGAIYASVGSEVIYSRLEEMLPLEVYISLVNIVNEWMKEKLIMLTARA